MADLEGLRRSLLEQGVAVGEITYPEYLPDGECCVTDPDGYTLMLAQSVTTRLSAAGPDEALRQTPRAA